MDMSASATPTGTMDMMASATAMHDHAASSTAMSMGGMDMGGSCKISMLWNWYTIDSCFLSSSWHVRSAGTFAGTCIGVMFLVIALEFLRRVQREFDRHLLQGSSPALSSRGRQSSDEEGSSPSGSGQSKQGTKITILPKFSVASGSQPKLWQHVVRSFLYMLQFAVGYFVMLLAMYYNGYIIIMIFVGAFFGALIFQWDTLTSQTGAIQKDSCCC